MGAIDLLRKRKAARRAAPASRSTPRQRLARAVHSARGRGANPRAHLGHPPSPSAARLTYARGLTNELRAYRRVWTPLLRDRLPAIQAVIRAEHGVRVDVSGRDLVDELIEALAAVAPDDRLKQSAEGLARRAAKQIARTTKAQTNAQYQSLLGLDLVTNEPYLAGAIEDFVEINVSLITSIPEDLLGQVRDLVLRSLETGDRVEQLADDIETRFDVSESRARLIARDQTGKLTGQLDETRQTENGVEEYTWSTVLDERVRPAPGTHGSEDHRALEGTTQRWDKPPLVDKAKGIRAHPGQRYQCRCRAVPKIPADLLAALSRG